MKFITMNEQLSAYVQDHCDLPHPVLRKVFEETQALESRAMQISTEQGAFMHMLVKLLNAKRILEIGCFTGFSTISMASALPDDGKLITCDVERTYTDRAEKYFREAQLDQKIQLRIAPALETLPKLLREFGPDSFDLAFIDADKENMQAYFEGALKLVRKNGLILVDNVLWSAKVLDKSDRTPPTEAIRAFNGWITKQNSVERMLLPLADGIYLLRKV